MWLFVLASLAAGVVTPRRAGAQEPLFDEFHTWTDLATIYNVSDRFRYDGDYGIRGLITDRNWTQWYLRPSVRYRPKTWLTLHGGAALFYTVLPAADLPELRPWVGVRVIGPALKGFVLRNYVRLELRAFYRKDIQEWDVGMRGRWQLQVSSPFFSMLSANEFYAVTSVEPFFDLSSNTVAGFSDRFRVTLGLGKVMSDALRVELNYLFHKVRIPDQGGSLDADDHVMRLRFFHTFY